MVTYNVFPAPLQVHDIEAMEKHAPSVEIVDRFKDGSINIEVADHESDDLTDYFDRAKIKYTMI